MNLITSIEAPDPNVPLEGRVLMLNTDKAPRFNCYGFTVSRNNPIQIVPKFAQEIPLRKALADGLLLDITSNEDLAAKTGIHKQLSEIDSAVKSGTFSINQDSEEAGKQILVGKDSKGNSCVIIPKDDEDYKRMQEELKTTGHLRVEKPKVNNFNILSPIQIDDIIDKT
jgi:hypothetical protein